MSLPRWADRAAAASSALGLVSATRTWTNAEVATAVRARAERYRERPFVALSGAASVERVLDVLAAIEAQVPALMLHPRWTEREAEAISERARRARIPDGALAILATSGTTGAPKLAVLSRDAFHRAAEASAAHLGAASDDRWLLAMPLAHVGGLGVVVRSLVYGTPLVVHEGTADPGTWFALADAARVTHVSLVPTGLARLLELGRPVPPSVRAVLLGGAACPTSVLERGLAAGWPLHPTYGLTEMCGQVATAARAIANSEAGRWLAPLPGVEIRLRNGTIHVRSPAAMSGWLDDASPFDADGFYDTGDLGELDANGRLTIHARRTDLVISGGENVYPREVEDALERIEGVLAACVFGVPDAEWGQRVAAALVTDARAPSDAEILARARCELAGFKLPRLVARLDALSTNATGKLDRATTAARSMPVLRAI